MTVNTNNGGGSGRAGVLLTPETHWVCNARGCDQTAVTREGGDHVRFHICHGRDGQAGMTVPMQRAGVRCDVRAVEREDYVGAEDVQLNANGRPVMSIITVREDGQDCTAYAPCATARIEDLA